MIIRHGKMDKYYYDSKTLKPSNKKIDTSIIKEKTLQNSV